MTDSTIRRPTIAQLDDIRFSYDRGASWALDGVSLTIAEGERICLTGPNGSGKSTLARLIAGLAAPDSGTVTLLGRRVFDDGPNADEYRQARRGIGAVFQNPEDQLVTTSLEDDVAFGPENLGLERSIIGERISTALAAVGLDHLRHADPTHFSGGQQQRAAIAGMLAMHPRLLVLDEPTTMLDEASRAEVLEILDELQARGTTIVHVTHHTGDTAHADRVLRLQTGRIQADAPADATDTTDGVSLLSQDATVHSPTELSSTGLSPLSPASAPQSPTTQSPTAPNSSTPDLTHDSGEPQQALAIVADHLAYGYANGRQPVFSDLCLHVRQGETVALMGANGSGKSTLARLLCALDRPSAGAITVAGVPVAPAKPKRRQLAELRRRVGYVMQHPERQLFADTVADDVAYGPRNQGLPDDEVARRVDEALRLLHIEHLADRSPFELSGGQQRLVAIAGVVASKPDVLVMDEPTASLDAAAKSRIHDLVHALRSQGVTMLIITHDRAEAALLADRILDMHQLAHPVSAGPEGSASHGTRSKSGEPAATTPSAQAEQRFSLMQRLDPRVKMVGFLTVMFSMFAVSTPMQLAAAALLTLAAILAARMSPLKVARTVHPILAMLVLMGLLNLFVVRTGTPLVTFGPVTITDDAVRFAVLYTCRFALVIIQGALFLATTGPTAITDAFASLLSPLGRLGLHTQELSLVMSLALRFIPTLTDEALAIRNAQAARGGSIETGSFGRKLRAMAAIIVPVLAGTMRHADNLALALDARCYEEGIRRTHWRRLAVRPRDIVFVGFVLGWLVALMAL